MYQEYFLESKGGRCVGLTTLPPSCADCHEIWNHQGLSRDSFTCYIPYLKWQSFHDDCCASDPQIFRNVRSHTASRHPGRCSVLFFPLTRSMLYT
jgi:hypothetical protein